MEEVKKIFFNGLNELRAFAALLVVFNHLEQFKNLNHMSSLFESPFFSYFIKTVGKNGVYLFFVLSGFLITYLLLKEKEKYQTILFKKFFLRRIFRIWPLYYLIVIIGFILIPFLTHSFDLFENIPYYSNLISNLNNYSAESFLLYLFFMPNVALYYYHFYLPGCFQAWSVGVEEQFYILWPILILIFARKIIIWVFLLLFTSFVFCQIYYQYILYTDFSNNLSFVNWIMQRFHLVMRIIPIEFMTIGAIGGFFYIYYKDKITNFSKSKFVYLGIVFLVFIFMFFSLFLIYFQNIILGFLFLFLILITISEDNTIVFRNKQMSYLGKISYGIYMYHPFVMFLVFPFANSYFNDSSITLYYNLFVYVFVFSLTILLSHFSYKHFESVFIKIKDTKYKSL